MAPVVLCDVCGGRSETIDSRTRSDGSYRRRRRCLGCGSKWTTTEVRVDDLVSPAKLERVKALVAELEGELRTRTEDDDESHDR